MAGIFKAYDIRGVYGDTLTDDIALKIGRAYATFLNCSKVVIGHDMRTHAKPLVDALSHGLTVQGVDVVNVGLCTTPMSYFANGLLGAGGSIMVTASHNPSEWNGFKLCREQAIPISGKTGIHDIEGIVNEESFAEPAAEPGKVSSENILARYIDHVKKKADLKRPIRIAADYANAMGIYEAKAIERLIEIDPLFETLDGSFPNHEANPLKTETLEALQIKIRAGSYDFGVAFDGDADRAGFVDEKGVVVPMDMITAMIAKSLLKEEKGIVLYDLRSSWAVKEIIAENGGTPRMCRVGHAFIKQQMRDEKAVFAGELSGHYYFRDNYYTESAAMAVLLVANVLSQTDKRLSELIEPMKRYHATGEINSQVENVDKILSTLREKYSAGRLIELDGVSVEFDDWWFNVRPSNTEPLVRLNLEANTEDLMRRRCEEVLGIIRKTG